MRLKHRYIICQALASEDSNAANSDEYTARDLQNIIKEQIESLFGDVGVGSFGTTSLIKAFDVNSKVFVLRTTREAETNLRLAISCVTSIENTNIVIRTLSLAGSSRTCTEKLRIIFNTLVENSNFNIDLKTERRKFYENVMTSLEL
jgi:RNase P/RNase MRP subunit POP5